MCWPDAMPRRREFLNLLRHLGNEWPIPLAGVWTREAYLAIRSDDQLEKPVRSHSASPGGSKATRRHPCRQNLVSSFPLRSPSPIATGGMARYLLERSEGSIGELARRLTGAAAAAVECGEKSINHTSLSLAEYNGPTERRRCSFLLAAPDCRLLSHGHG